MNRKVLTAAAISAFAILNIVGLYVISSGSPFGSFDNTASGEPRIHEDGAGRDFATATDDVSANSEVFSEGESSEGDSKPGETLPEVPGRGGPPDVFGPGGGGPKGAREAYELQSLANEASVGIEVAEEAATSDVPGTIIESKLEEDDEAPFYVVTVLGEDGNLHEFEVEGSGEISEAEIKASDDAEEARLLLEEASVSREDAASLVTEEFGGEVVENKLTEEEGYVAHEVEVLTADGRLYESFVDARNGEILSEGMIGDASAHRPGIGPGSGD